MKNTMRYSNFVNYTLGVCATAATLAGCSSGATTPIGSSSSSMSQRSFPSSSGQKHLYVVSGGNYSGSIAVFSLQAYGNATPLSVIRGTKTSLDGSGGIAVDRAGNTYASNRVADADWKITSYAAGSSGNVSPLTKIEGGKTGLGYPTGVAVDSSGKIYVANPQAGYTSITVYAAGTTGNTPPVSTIRGPHTRLNFPYGVTLDAADNIYAANTSGNSITVYSAGASGDAAPIRTIRGSKTGLSGPVAEDVGANGNLYVANLGMGSHPSPTITVYAAGANGNVKPIVTIGGSATRLSQPDGVAVGPAGGIYVANTAGPNILVFGKGAHGNTAPNRVIHGSNTGFGSNTGLVPTGVAVH